MSWGLPGQNAAVLSATLAVLAMAVLPRYGVLPSTAQDIITDTLCSNRWKLVVPACAALENLPSAPEGDAQGPAVDAHDEQHKQLDLRQQPLAPAPTPGHWPHCHTDFPVIHWDRNDPGTLNRVLALRQPALLLGAPSDDWAAQNWTIPSLRGVLGHTVVPNVIVSQRPRLYYYNKAFPMFQDLPMQRRRWREPYTVQNLPPDDLFRLVQPLQSVQNRDVDDVVKHATPREARKDSVIVKDQGTLAYFSSQIRKIPEVGSELLADLHPPFGYQSDRQATTEGDKRAAVDEASAWRPSLWVGSAGTVAHLHWDSRCVVVLLLTFCSFWCNAC